MWPDAYLNVNHLLAGSYNIRLLATECTSESVLCTVLESYKQSKQRCSIKRTSLISLALKYKEFYRSFCSLHVNYTCDVHNNVNKSGALLWK